MMHLDPGPLNTPVDLCLQCLKIAGVVIPAPNERVYVVHIPAKFLQRRPDISSLAPQYCCPQDAVTHVINILIIQ